MNWLRSLLLGLILIIGFAVLAPKVSAFSLFGDSCQGKANSSAICQEVNNTGTNNPVSGKDSILAKVIRILSYIIGLASVIIVILGGFNYVTAEGNAEKAGRAKDRILYAVVGLVVALIAWAIAAFFTHHLL